MWKRVKGIVYYILNYLPSGLFFCMFGNVCNNYSGIKSMRGKYLNKRCFVIGNGPSLTAEDLDKLKQFNEISFSANEIDRIFASTNWRPTFYTVMDLGVFKKMGIRRLSRIPAEKKFFRINNYISSRRVNGDCLNLLTLGSRKYLEKPRFSSKCEKSVYTIATVTYVSLQLAAYMGFKEIYIIGCDNSYSKTLNKDGQLTYDSNKQSYFLSDKQSIDSVGAVWEMEVAYDYARRWADQSGIKIYNATRGGYLEAFERVNFDDLFVNGDSYE